MPASRLKPRKEWDRERRVAWVLAAKLLEDRDCARVHPQAEVDDAEEVVALSVAWLEVERAFELLFRFVNAVVMEQLTAAVEMKEEVFLGRIRLNPPNPWPPSPPPRRF